MKLISVTSTSLLEVQPVKFYFLSVLHISSTVVQWLALWLVLVKRTIPVTRHCATKGAIGVSVLNGSTISHQYDSVDYAFLQVFSAGAHSNLKVMHNVIL